MLDTKLGRRWIVTLLLR